MYVCPLVTCYHMEASARSSVGHRYAAHLRNRHCGRYSRYNLKWNPRFEKCGHFLAASSEYKWITALEAHHHVAFAAFLNKYLVYLRLLLVVTARLLADIYPAAVRLHHLQKLIGSESVIYDCIALFYEFQALHRDESRVAGACAYQIYHFFALPCAGCAGFVPTGLRTAQSSCLASTLNISPL